MDRDSEPEPSQNSHSNALLRYLTNRDVKLIQPFLDTVEGHSGQVLYHPGDVVETTYFPCGPTLISFAVAVEEDREVDVVLVGREGAVGGMVSHGLLPAYSRISIKIAGPMMRLSIRRLEEAQGQSASLRRVLAQYTDCLLAQIFQSTACNAAHSIEQRAAKWILTMAENSGTENIQLTHEKLATLLGIGRSYASRIIQDLKADGSLSTRRGTLSVRDVGALERKSCQCNALVKKHFAEILPDH